MTTATKSKKKKAGRAEMIDHYMNSVLEHERAPVSVFKFCKELKISEQDFYQEFGSLESLKKSIWTAFFEQTLEVMQKSEEYAEYGSKEKLLALYFTLFEILTLNRSYILQTTEQPNMIGNNLPDLQDFRVHFKKYLSQLEIPKQVEQEKINKVSSKAVEELGWGQFLLVLKFWMTDDSPGFEKTDILIEKTINSAFELVDIRPVKGVIDLAKFLIKERWKN